MTDVTETDSERRTALETSQWVPGRWRRARRGYVCRRLGALICGVAACAIVMPAAASANPVAEFPEVIEAATAERPATLTPTAQSVIKDGSALVGDAQASNPAEEARGVRRLKELLTRGKFFPTATQALRGAGVVGLATLGAYQVCKAEALDCWLFERDQQLAPVPTGWRLAPWLVEFLREDGRDGIRQWPTPNDPYYFYRNFQPVDANGRGGGSASWSGDPLCHPACYPGHLQRVGPLEYAVTSWGGAWDERLWWLPTHGPASVPTFASVAMAGYGQDPLRLIYRSLISTQNITPDSADDPDVPNADSGVTVPYDADWADVTAAVLADPDNRAALELLKRRIQQRTVTLPTCLGIAFEACSQSMRDAGLTGTITEHTLSADEAIMEEDADRVTAIYPGGTVLRTDEITVYVNPETMPTMTATETLVATQLEQRTPTS